MCIDEIKIPKYSLAEELLNSISHGLGAVFGIVALVLMLIKDRKLFKYYFFKLDEIYPSKLSALRDISKNRSIRFKIKFCLYSLLVWTRLL